MANRRKLLINRGYKIVADINGKYIATKLQQTYTGTSVTDLYNQIIGGK